MVALDSTPYSRCGSARRDEKEAHFEQFLGSKPVTHKKKQMQKPTERGFILHPNPYTKNGSYRDGLL